MINVSEITIVKSDRRTLSLQIKPDGTVRLFAPRHAGDGSIRRFIKDHEMWIENHLKRIRSTPKPGKRMYEDGAEFMYLGDAYTLKIDGVRSLEFKHPHLYYPKHLEFRIAKEIPEWYRKNAQTVITASVEHHARIMGTSYAGLYFSDTSSKWGSCSADNRLQFNWRLIMAPMLVIRYVVIHELAHTVEHNHSRVFWRTVEKYNPSYRQEIKWLKTHGRMLVV